MIIVPWLSAHCSESMPIRLHGHDTAVGVTLQSNLSLPLVE
jgi:hypothetical protein